MSAGCSGKSNAFTDAQWDIRVQRGELRRPAVVRQSQQGTGHSESSSANAAVLSYVCSCLVLAADIFFFDLQVNTARRCRGKHLTMWI